MRTVERSCVREMEDWNEHRGIGKGKLAVIILAICLIVFCTLNYVTTGRLFPCFHNWKEATCTEPETCTICGKTMGEPLGHDWDRATCTQPKTCKRCGETMGSAVGHEWIPETETTPKICSRCGEMVPKALPATGEIITGRNLGGRSTITIKSSAEESYYIKLKDTSGQDVMSFFVRAGESTTVYVPERNLQVFFACGNDWYGPVYLFGDETAYSKDDDFVDFSQYTITYTLYPVTGGNFTETEIPPDEF